MCILENQSLTLDELMDYLVKREAQDKINMNRIKKFYNDNESFNNLMNKIVEKDFKRFEKIIKHEKNIPKPSKILDVIFDIVQCDGEETFDSDSNTRKILYHNWMFLWIHGNGGTVISIFNPENKLIYQF
jgi:hypothetical protein